MSTKNTIKFFYFSPSSEFWKSLEKRKNTHGKGKNADTKTNTGKTACIQENKNEKTEETC